MARHNDDGLDTAVPEADQLEQQQPADPGHEWPHRATPVADEADRLEQAHEVLADEDEEYPPSQPKD